MKNESNHPANRKNAGAVSNIDYSEIAKFEALAARWWDPHSEFRPLHDINPLRLGFIEKRTELAGKTVLDVGCGGGILCEGLAYRGATVTGIDMGEAPLAVARLHASDSDVEVEYRRCTAEQLALECPARFDVVTCLEMLEHVPDPSATVRACVQLARPGGHLYFSTINRNPKAWLFAIIGAEHILKLLPKGTHEYDKFIRPSELASWLRSAGGFPREVTGMTYNPVTQTYRLERDASVNYLMHAIRPK